MIKQLMLFLIWLFTSLSANFQSCLEGSFCVESVLNRELKGLGYVVFVFSFMHYSWNLGQSLG